MRQNYWENASGRLLSSETVSNEKSQGLDASDPSDMAGIEVAEHKGNYKRKKFQLTEFISGKQRHI